MFDSLEVKSFHTLMEVKGREAQRRHREGASEGSAEQTREPMNTNRIARRERRTASRCGSRSTEAFVVTFLDGP